MADTPENKNYTSPYSLNSHIFERDNMAPGDTFKITEPFEWITVETGVNVEVLINGMPPAVKIPARVGFKNIVPNTAVRFILVRNADPALTQNISVRYGTGDIIDNRLAGTVIITTTPGVGVQLAKPASSNTAQFAVSGAAAVQLRPLTAARYTLTIQSGSDDLYIGNSNAVTGLTGLKIAADSTYVMESTDAVWARRAAAVVASACSTREEIY